MNDEQGELAKCPYCGQWVYDPCDSAPADYCLRLDEESCVTDPKEQP